MFIQFRNKKQDGSCISGVRLLLLFILFFSRFPGNKKPSVLSGFWILLIFAVFPDFRYTYMASDFFYSDFFLRNRLRLLKGKLGMTLTPVKETVFTRAVGLLSVT